ncbi:MAG: HisA/HisF-related TIM barrel protein [Gallintestinimicrobium sp.]
MRILRQCCGKERIKFLSTQQLQSAADRGRRKSSKQCVVVAIDARRRTDGAEGWTVYKNGGRIDTGLDAVEWARKAQELGVGRFCCEHGLRWNEGGDIPLTRAIAQNVSIPVIASGGAGKMGISEALTDGMADAALAASLFTIKSWKLTAERYLKEGWCRWQ